MLRRVFRLPMGISRQVNRSLWDQTSLCIGQDMALLLSSCDGCSLLQAVHQLPEPCFAPCFGHLSVRVALCNCCCLSSCVEHAPTTSTQTQMMLNPAGIMVSGCFNPEGGLWMWGANTNSQLGKGDEEEDELVPLKVRRAEICVPLTRL